MACTSAAGREAQRFLVARSSSRLSAHPSYRGTGEVSDLYLGESESAGELVALKVARDRQTEASDLDDSFRRFLQEYEIVQAHP